jgi:pimeloyl-ACP methyl ester carboxylesterase
MYQKQKSVFQNGRVIMTLIMAFVCVLSLGAAGDAGNYYKGADVESIYESIRHASPEYEGTESIVTFENEGMTLVCTLTVPNTGKKAPIVITLNGFLGARDEEPIPGTNETVFGRTSSVLAGHGIASLRIDFRGSGDSDGDYTMTTFSTQVSDVLAAIEFIRNSLNDQVDKKRIGIIGFSQGGSVGITTAVKSEHVDSVVLWSAPAFPPYDYEGLLTRDGIKAGMALEDGGTITLPLFLEGQPLGFDANLGKGFFEELFRLEPVAEVAKYKGPVMYIAGKTDPIVWPQPGIGETFMKYHKGAEKLVKINGDHEFDYWNGPEAEKLTDAIYWSTAWFIKTIK